MLNDLSGETTLATSYVRKQCFPYFGCSYKHTWGTWWVVVLEGDNLIKVTAAYEDSTQIGVGCITVRYVPDVIAPSIPGNFTATAISAAKIDLSWESSTDNATTDDASIRYEIYRDGSYMHTVAETSMSDKGLNPGTQYCYSLTATDTANNESQHSPEVCVTTLDQSAPTAPSMLGALVTATRAIELSWIGSTDDVAVTGYTIYRNSQYLTSTASTSFLDTGVSPDTRYCYIVSAYDGVGNESLPSDASCSDTSWSTFIIDGGYSSTGLFSSITMTPPDAVHIGYSSANSLKYASNKSGIWITETIDNNGIVGKYPSIASDGAGHIHLSYYDTGFYSGGRLFWRDDLKHASNASGAWVTEKIANGGWFSSLDIDSTDNLHVSYRGNGLSYANNVSGAWQAETISAPDFWTSLAIDKLDKMHITSFQGYPDYDLIYTTNTSGAWVSEPVDSDRAGEFNDLEIDVDGKAHISYCKYFGGLKYANNMQNIWETVAIDSNRCGHTSLALDSNGHIHISYVSQSGSPVQAYLKYATNAPGTWEIIFIDKAGSQGYYAYATSLVLDSAGNPHISYYGDNGVLKYATTR